MAYRVVLALSLCVGITIAASFPRRDTTIEIPDDVTYHAQSKDICTPTSWTDVVSFFMGNYLSHVATVVTAPGQPLYITVMNMFFVLLFPALGAGRGLTMIYQRASFYKDPLKQALNAQALVMVIRDRGWKPENGDFIRSLSLYAEEVGSKRARAEPDEYYKSAHSKRWIKSHVEKIKGYIGPIKTVTEIPPWLTMHYGYNSKHIRAERGYHVSGIYDLPEGYRLAYVPPNAQVEKVMPESELIRILQSSYSLPSGIISIVQIFSAASSLYKSKGYQISAYGYAAFGFTVTPYLVMSLLNLLANCFTPKYPNLYLVHTEIMDEAIRRGGRFTDIVGKLESEPLVAEDLTIFSGAFRKQNSEDWCQISEQVFVSGTTEPIIGEEKRDVDMEIEIQDHDRNGTLENLSLPQEDIINSAETAKKEPTGIDCAPVENSENGDWTPTLIIPGCYRFKVAYQSASSTSILHRDRHYGPRAWIFLLIIWMVAAIPFIPIGVMSKFRPAQSTVAQRAWLMTWYAVGIVSVSNPYFTDFLVEFGYHESRRLMKDQSMSHLRRTLIMFNRSVSMFVFAAVTVTPAIGGFAVVGQMLIDYGSCTGI